MFDIEQTLPFVQSELVVHSICPPQQMMTRSAAARRQDKAMREVMDWCHEDLHVTDCRSRPRR